MSFGGFRKRQKNDKSKSLFILANNLKVLYFFYPVNNGCNNCSQVDPFSFTLNMNL